MSEALSSAARYAADLDGNGSSVNQSYQGRPGSWRPWSDEDTEPISTPNTMVDELVEAYDFLDLLVIDARRNLLQNPHPDPKPFQFDVPISDLELRVNIDTLGEFSGSLANYLRDYELVASGDKSVKSRIVEQAVQVEANISFINERFIEQGFRQELRPSLELAIGCVGVAKTFRNIHPN